MRVHELTVTQSCLVVVIVHALSQHKGNTQSTCMHRWFFYFWRATTPMDWFHRWNTLSWTIAALNYMAHNGNFFRIEFELAIMNNYLYRCWYTVISLLVEFGRTHFSNFHSCCCNNLYINMENGSYFVHKKLTLVYKVCVATLSVYPHRASLKNMPGHGGIGTYDLWNASPMLCQLSYAVRSVRVCDISELTLVPSIPM